MSAGYIQLAAIGQQDAYLSGSPEITYFSGVYKRHTPFVLEAYDIPFQNQKVVYGQNNICKIPPKGDLIRALTLKIDLPALYDPGNFWAWPTQPSSNFDPKIIINGRSYVLPIQGLTYYSTINLASWIRGGLDTFITYSESINKFIFTRCSTVEVDDTGIFWGLDPKFGTLTSSSNLVYNFSGTTSSQFTLEQAGWTRNTGLPYVDTKTGLFLDLPTTGYKINKSFSFFNLSSWTNQNLTPYYQITKNGRIKFKRAGTYILRAGFYLGTGSVLNLSYGSDSNESLQVNGIPLDPVFTYSVDFRISPDPSMPMHVPIVVNDITQSYYFFLTTTSGVTQLMPGSYVTITPTDDVYQFKNPVSITGQTQTIVPFYGNISNPSNQSVTLNPDSSFTFSTSGIWLITGVIYLNQTPSSNYVSTVSVWNSTGTIDYSYDTLGLMGRDPTFAFTMPINVTSTSTKYYTNIYTENSTSILSNTYYTIKQIGDPNGIDYVLSTNGILLSPSTTLSQSSYSPLNFRTNWKKVNPSYDISINSSGNLVLNNVATYMMTAVFSASDNVRSITFGTSTYTFDMSYQTYTVNIPLNVTQNSTEVPITVGTDNSTTNFFSNTYITVYPVSNTLETKTYSYYDSVGTWAVKQADLVIGGQTVQTLTGEYIELYNDLYVPYENQPGLKLLTGKYDSTQIIPPGRTYYVNLPFYFYKNPGLALPVTALNRQDVEIHVTLRNLQELTNVSISTITTPLTATIITEYVYLSEPEINWFKKSQINYVIQQCQYQTFNLGSKFTSGVLKLNFINPIRELFFVTQLEGTAPYEYSDLNSLGLNFNSSEAFTEDVTDSIYLNCIEPFNHYINYPTRTFYMYSFTTQTNTPIPYGQVNFSRIRDIFIKLNTNSYSSKQFRVIGVNYNILTIKDGIAGIMFNSNDY